MLASMSELPEGIEPAPIPEPKDSALGIVVRRSSRGALEVLMGRRARGARFMPGHLAFPGGKLELGDQPGRPGALERCASREIQEETGVGIPPEAWHDAGERTTPPFFSVRYRTRFFVADAPGACDLPATLPAPEEIESLGFHDPADVSAEWEAGRALVPPPLLPILRMMDLERPASAVALAARIEAINREEEPNPRIEFEPGVWVLPLRTRTLPPASCTNVWMPGGRRFVVIDPGSAEPAENEKLLRVVDRRVRQGCRVEAVVLTHHHRDHVSGAATIAAALRVPVMAHSDTLARLARELLGVATRALADGDEIDLDGMSLRALHTPGHAPGHLAFFDARRRVLIAGDLVSGLSTILVGFADGDMDAYLDTLARMAALAPRSVLPAHGPPLPGRVLEGAIAHREAREALVSAALGSAARPLAEVARDAYADTPGAPAFLRELQTGAHLRRLARRGDAVEHANGSGWSRPPAAATSS